MRVVLSAAPIVLTSSNSLAYLALVSGFGGRPRNFEASPIRNGLTSLSHAPGSLMKSGTSGRHAPTADPAVNRKGPKRPSSVRAAIMASAAALPVAIPPSFAAPGGIVARAASYSGFSRAASAGCCAAGTTGGRLSTSTRYAAVAAAASREYQRLAAGATR